MTRRAYRVLDDDRVVYLMPYLEGGERVVYRQDPETFDTQRDTVPAQKARTLAESGREVELYETPAWCDRGNPYNDSGRAAP